MKFLILDTQIHEKFICHVIQKLYHHQQGLLIPWMFKYKYYLLRWNV